METNFHNTVLLNETVDSLEAVPDGIYCDLTAGRGGHSALLLSRLGENGRLVCIDRDPDAVSFLKERFACDRRVTVVKAVFSDLRSILDGLGIDRVDGVLADLGVSSPQLDNVSRGFSYHGDAPLDMRMDTDGGITAADIVNTYTEREIADILFRYGEEKLSRRIAAAICRERENEPILTTLRLAQIVSEAYPAAKRRDAHPARKTFQALRIAVNDELNILEKSLSVMFSSLKIGGKMSVISFHSLEDRAVKTFFASLCRSCHCDPHSPICTCSGTPRARLNFKFVKPGEQEIENNHRSRSAVLRSITKLKEIDDI